MSSVAAAGMSGTDWLATLAAVRSFILVQQAEQQAHQQEVVLLLSQPNVLASELAQLRDRIGRSSRNFSKPPSSDGPGFKPPEQLSTDIENCTTSDTEK